jgi:hypothetical protein
LKLDSCPRRIATASAANHNRDGGTSQSKRLFFAVVQTLIYSASTMLLPDYTSTAAFAFMARIHVSMHDGDCDRNSCRVFGNARLQKNGCFGRIVKTTAPSRNHMPRCFGAL